MAMPPLRRRALLGALAASPLAARAAEAWPSRPVRLIVGYPAGASTDLCARILAEDMRTRIGQPVLVENKNPGANGSLGAAAVAAAEPDGHTLLVSNTSTMTVNHLLYRDIRYHPLRDLLPVASITLSPFILTTSNRRARGRSPSARSPSCWPWPAPIRAGSVTARAATATCSTCTWSNLPPRPASACCTCLSAAPRRRRTRWSPATWT